MPTTFLATDVVTSILYALGGLVAILAAAHLILPILVKVSVWIAAPTIEEIPLEAADLPPKEQDHLAQRGAELEALGFEFGALVRVNNYMPHETSYMAMYARPAERVSAAAVAKVNRITTQHGTRDLWKRYTEFVTEYQGGRQVMTNNYNAPENTCDLFEIVRLRGEHDTTRLFTAHRVAVRRYSRGQTPIAIREGDAWWIGALQRSLNAVVDSEARAGTMAQSPDGKWRLTWKGAYLRMWQVLWPWGLIRRWRAGRERREIVNEAERESG